MNLYLITQSVNRDYDTYDSAVVAAESAEEAQNFPLGDEDPDEREKWGWTTPEHVTVKLLGIAHPDVEAGLVCASYNAG